MRLCALPVYSLSRCVEEAAGCTAFPISESQVPGLPLQSDSCSYEWITETRSSGFNSTSEAGFHIRSFDLHCEVIPAMAFSQAQHNRGRVIGTECLADRARLVGVVCDRNGQSFLIGVVQVNNDVSRQPRSRLVCILISFAQICCRRMKNGTAQYPLLGISR